MVMTRPPAYHFREFLMKNMIPTNSCLMFYSYIWQLCQGTAVEFSIKMVGTKV